MAWGRLLSLSASVSSLVKWDRVDSPRNSPRGSWSHALGVGSLFCQLLAQTFLLLGFFFQLGILRLRMHRCSDAGTPLWASGGRWERGARAERAAGSSACGEVRCSSSVPVAVPPPVQIQISFSPHTRALQPDVRHGDKQVIPCPCLLSCDLLLSGFLF